ncbi:MAG: lactate utilization protein [Bryobacteraceae bacterium]
MSSEAASREAIFTRIRTALGRSAGQAPPPVPEIYLKPSSPKLSTFFACIERLNGKTLKAGSNVEARDYVSALVRGKRAVASNSTVLRDTGIAGLPEVTTAGADKSELRRLCAESDIGISSADYGLADTGTLVMVSSHQEPRMISLLPPLHIAIVPESRIIGNLDELLRLLPTPADQTSSMVLITGPSRTGDIEQILVRGVHGPGELHVVVI